MLFSARCLTVVVLLSLVGSVGHAHTTHFQAILTNDAIIRQGVVGTASLATGIADFVLVDPHEGDGEVTMAYTIRLSGVDVDGNQTANLLDDLVGVHLHDSSECATPTCQPGDTVDTHHLLNIYGFPRGDDGDVHADPLTSTITGIWDDSDANPAFPPSQMISDKHSLHALHNEVAFLMIHTNQVPSGAIGGFLRIVPEPSLGGGVLLGLFAILRPRRS